jgi:GntR family transcriptional regulator
VIVHVDPGDPTPVYEQLRAQITRMVASGALAAGTRLPTIRQLAADLGLAKGTVAKAYEALLRDGVVEAGGRRGTVVLEAPTLPRAERRRRLDTAAEELAVLARQLDLDIEEVHDAVERAMQVR